MTSRGLHVRLLRLEGRSGWSAWRHLPMAAWPDQALVRFLGDTGAWRPAPGQTEPSDAELRRIAGECDA